MATYERSSKWMGHNATLEFKDPLMAWNLHMLALLPSLRNAARSRKRPQASCSSLTLPENSWPKRLNASTILGANWVNKGLWWGESSEYMRHKWS